ncbi:hypothetical protein SteCoe_16223 [Stentor coeruleus]|uniref:Transmembrane protein n=1 Tax=Stentor coeruleus TaxID=5963 RepID=A0A1R2C1U1_9CILI|nr:hypothetical protein SteCoe_16223 [Stentor coeruleus]
MFNKFIILLLGLYSITATDSIINNLQSNGFSYFFEGFLQGVQVDPSNPSNCVKSYSMISSSFDIVLKNLVTLDLNIIFNLINDANDFINQFMASYELCNYALFTEKYLTDQSTAILNVLINAFGNFSQLINSIVDFVNAIGSGDYMNMGFFFGKIIRYAFGVSL